MKPISISMFCHNEGELIRSSMKSVSSNIRSVREVYSKFEFELNVLIDSGDSETYKEIENLNEDSINVIDLETKDLGVNRNIAAERARFDLISFIDADDVWGKNWLVKSLSCENLGDNYILHPEFVFYFGEKPEIMVQESSDNWKFSKDIESANCWTSSVILSKEVILKTPYQSKSKILKYDFEDWDWTRRTLKASYIHKVVPETCHFVRRRTNSHSSRQIMEWERN